MTQFYGLSASSYPVAMPPPLTSAYVAGSTGDIVRVRQVQELVRCFGLEITFDWTGPDGQIKADWSDAADQARAHSSKERQAVIDAGITILCWHPQAVGALLETGIALGQGRPVVVLGDARESVFWYLPGVKRAADLDELRDHLASLIAQPVSV